MSTMKEVFLTDSQHNGVLESLELQENSLAVISA